MPAFIDIRIVSIVTLSTLALVGSCQTQPNEDGSDSEPVDPIEHGAEIYQQYCAFCHGDDGEGYVSDNANALSNQSFMAVASDELLSTSVHYGRPGTPMSAWGEEKAGPFSETDVDHLVQFMRTWQTVEPKDVDDYEVDPSSTIQRGETYYGVEVEIEFPEGFEPPVEGKTKYSCEDCHGAQGFGGHYMTIENPWFLTQVSDGYLREAIAEGRPGTPMMAYAERFPEAQQEQMIDDLITLVRSWEREPDTDPIPPYDPDVSGAVVNPDGDDPDWELIDGRYIGVDTVKAALDDGHKMILLDARPHADFVEGHLADAVSVPFFDLHKVIDELPTDVWIVNYCGCPHAVSGQSFDALAEAGFTKIAVLDEGYYEWVDRGYPTEEGE